MINVKKNAKLKIIEEAVINEAKNFERKIPEIRFFSLDGEEFTCLLEKNVYPVSPINIWEGKNVIKRRFLEDIGVTTGLYYEVVQTGNPSYAYLNENNSLTTQASVMAHVIGHCEFSMLNVMKDSDEFRTEKVIFLVKKINNAMNNMGFSNYKKYWNSCESIVPLTYSGSQYNLENSIESEVTYEMERNKNNKIEKEIKKSSLVSSTLDAFLQPLNQDQIIEEVEEEKNTKETIDRKGYKIKAPCQDIFGFLTNFANASKNEKYILEYMYFVSKHHEFIGKTQIMNEGWSMFWEKKIMTELFKKHIVTDIIDYCRVFSGVCYPRPYFKRNPYHMGYNMWKHIEENFKKGKITIEYAEEKDRTIKEDWNKKPEINSIKYLEKLISTITDYEFIRRFLDDELINKLSLNKIPIEYIEYFAINDDGDENIIEKTEDNFFWIKPKFVKDEMLKFFTNFGRPMIYIIDADFEDGGLLLYHRFDEASLKEEWIGPTMKNMNYIWKFPIYLISDTTFYRFSGNKLTKKDINPISFEEIKEKLANNKKPFINK